MRVPVVFSGFIHSSEHREDPEMTREALPSEKSGPGAVYAPRETSLLLVIQRAAVPP